MLSKNHFISTIILTCTLLIPMLGWVPLFKGIDSDTPLDKIEHQFQLDLDDFDQSVDKLYSVSEDFKNGKIDFSKLRDQIIATRLAFKRIEHFAEYFQPMAVKNFINGAPLPKIDPVVPMVEVNPPNGLQTLDEAIFAEEVDAQYVFMLSKNLKIAKTDLLGYVKHENLEHRYVMEAARFQMLRTFTLSLTGFDTPGSVNAIPESIASLQSLLDNFQAYGSFAKGEHSYYKLMHDLQHFIEYLKAHQDFDSLDRLHVLTEFVNPLYASIYDLQKALQIEFVDEVDPTQSAVNYHAKEIFDTDFLNASYYAEIAKQDLYDPKKVELGKILFFDPALSKNVEMSCSSCHHPNKAFTDGLPKSKSNTEGMTTMRNAPTLINAVYAEKYFWDMREYDLERQVKHVVYDHKEFNMDFTDLADRLKESEEYLSLFKAAYGDRDKYIISTWSISNALAAYVTSLSSWNSPFDKYVNGELKKIAPEVKRGFNLFMGKAACGTCHFAPTFNGTVPPLYQETESEVLGVTTTFDTLSPILDPDPGRIESKIPRDEAAHLAHAFKTMTVRNAELTAPYMHNGAFKTLEEVMHFYNQGGGAGMGLEIPNQTLPDARLDLSRQEMDDIIAFMESLTDTVGMTDVPVRLPEFESHPEWSKRKVMY
jgi:cytochrome c peroxidase